ncbi:hypothetical protein BST97_14665 [Nonlabens spongiae]|uniref:DUF6438 domain-containing protein n=1 Tax=Nonlabens spongiae TaxID=331648 RepID=A0A1W6MNP3_9FLAO|nr:DUF6438 domain-containing protein [Nonlabens spongiae]ARN79126.1 hypothetical protein BST97_14665 [Nonlabens spongiae]
MKYLQILAIVILCASCASTSTDQTIDLQGKWLEKHGADVKNVNTRQDNSEMIPQMPQAFRYNGFQIINDRYDNYTGFQEVVSDSSGGRSLKYYGHLTDYRLSGDSLEIYNPITKKYYLKGVLDVQNDDSVILVKRGDSTRYERQIIENYENFDRIELDASRCFGTCPNFSISISQKGDINFEGKAYTPLKGKYVSQASFPLVDYVFSKFEQQPILKYQDRYEDGGTDQQTITLRFYQAGKLVKTIEDYGTASPQELLWAIQPLKNLYLRDELNWERIQKENN